MPVAGSAPVVPFGTIIDEFDDVVLLLKSSAAPVIRLLVPMPT
jgi:hypothetical protein